MKLVTPIIDITQLLNPKEGEFLFNPSIVNVLLPTLYLCSYRAFGITK